MGRPRKIKDSELIELHGDGLLDVEIAEIMGIDKRTVFSRRKALGLPKAPQHKRTAWVFRVYDRETRRLVMEGSAAEIARRLYISTSTVRWYAKQTSAGMKCRYDVYRVLEETA